MKLDPLLTEAQRLVRDSARRFAGRHGGTARLRRVRESASGLDREALRAAGEAGWLGLLLSEQSGGAGFGAAELTLVAEELGRELCVLPLGGAAGSAAVLAECATLTPEARTALLSGETLGLAAHDDGSTHTGNAAVAPRQEADGGWRISGRCDGLPAADATHYVVAASYGSSRLVFHLPAEANGVAVDAGRAVDGSVIASLVLDDVHVPQTAVIASGDAAARLAMRLSAVLQLALAAEMLGVMEEAFARTLDYLRTRVQFGRPIGKFQALRHRAVDDFVQMEMARALVHEAGRAVAAAGTDAASLADAERLARAARVIAGEASLVLTKSAIQMHGAIGFTDEHDIGLFLERAMTLSTLYGSTGLQRRRYRNGLQVNGHWAGVPRCRTESDADTRFRIEIRAWLEDALPEELRNLPTRPPFAQAMAWHRRLHERSLIAPGWPQAWGGMGASLTRQVIVADELARIGAPEISAQAINHIGPILMRFGSEEQKQRHLPAMLSGEAVWCQGYSEPGAGSDLAGLRTRAEVAGDHLVVTGQKIWTTWAHHADWMFALVRTDPRTDNKHEGISFVLVDMRSPGITCRPIRTLAGEDELAEVFLDAVRVPLGNLVGELGGGWKIAQALLVNERLGSSSTQRDVAALRYAWHAAAAAGLDADAAFIDRLAGAEIKLLALTAAHAQAVALLEAGETGAQSSLIKLAGATLLQRLSDLLFEAATATGNGHVPLALHDKRFDAARYFLQNRRATIYGGTQEIQKEIVAKRLLELP